MIYIYTANSNSLSTSLLPAASIVFLDLVQGINHRIKFFFSILQNIQSFIPRDVLVPNDHQFKSLKAIVGFTRFLT